MFEQVVDWSLLEARASGCRGVKIITGKGVHSSGGGVLGPHVHSMLVTDTGLTVTRHAGHIDVLLH